MLVVVLPTPSGIDFVPGEIIGSCLGALGLHQFCDNNNLELVVTADKEVEGCKLDKEIESATYLITTPFHPAYITAERIKVERFSSQPFCRLYDNHYLH